MKSSIQKISIKIKKNLEVSFLLILVFISIVITQFYNLNKKQTITNYKNIINNIYFKKSLNHVFNNITPRYKNITHKVLKGETFDNIR